MSHPPPQETVSDGTPSSAPLFEVEISVGHRAIDSDQGRVATSARASAPSPLALQRQRRVKQRRQLFTIGALVIGLALSVWGTAAGWQAILQGNVVARVNGQPITMEQ